MEIVLTGRPIPHDIQYFLDSAVECFDIPLDVYLWAKFFNSNTASLIDELGRRNDLRADEHWRTLKNYGQHLEQIYLEWQTKAPTENVALCLAYAMYYMRDSDQTLAAMISRLVDFKSSILLAGKSSCFPVAYEGKDYVVFDGLKMFENIKGHFESLHRIRTQWAEIEKPDWTQVQIVRPNVRPANIRFEDITYRPVARVLPKPKRKALRRSADLLDTITGTNTTQLFLSGNEVSVTGKKYRFSLTKDKFANLGSSHGAARTRVYDAKTNEFICGLCVYTENVTVFDHLASIVLHCKSGLEDMIIMEANITERGNIRLLPDEKLKQLEKPNHTTLHEFMQNAIEKAEINVGLAVERVNKQPNEPLQTRIQRMDNKAKAKLSRRLLKLYPTLVGYKCERPAVVPELFSWERLLVSD